MDTWIADTFTSDLGWKHLERLVDIGNRAAGSPGEREAAEATAAAFDRVGAGGIRLDEFPIQGWVRGSSAIHAGETTQPCIALPRSPNRTATGQLVDLGHGLPSDYAEASLADSVAMVRSSVPDYYDRYIHRREKYYRAVEAGAAAFVYRNHVEGCLPPTGSVGTTEHPIGEIPAVGVSAEVGARLARRWAGEAVTVSVDAVIDDATSANVHADLGPSTTEQVLVSSHVDAHDIAEGAGDNGAGTAMVLELARALAAREAELDTRVHLVCYGAEEVGLRGSEHHADQADLDSVKVILNNDGVVRARTLSLSTHGFEPLETAIDGIADRMGHPIETVPEHSPHSDHWPFVKHGVPGYHASSVTGESGRGWGHTAADTLDKLERRTLREQAILLTDLVVHLASDGFDVAPKDANAIAAELEEQGAAEGMRLISDWPY